MSKDDMIEAEGEVIEALRGATFRVKLYNNAEMICHISGRIRKNLINILPGDKVMVEISPYDLSKGRITYRIK